MAFNRLTMIYRWKDEGKSASMKRSLGKKERYANEVKKQGCLLQGNA